MATGTIIDDSVNLTLSKHEYWLMKYILWHFKDWEGSDFKESEKLTKLLIDLEAIRKE